MIPSRHRRLPRAAAAFLALAWAATAALAATDAPPPRGPASLFPPGVEKDAPLPPLLPPMFGIDVPNRVSHPFVRYVHRDPALGRTLTFDRPGPKAANPVGRRGVAYRADPGDVVAGFDAPWSAKIVGAAGPAYDTIRYSTNVSVTNGGAFIPPDSHAAVGPQHIVAVTNVSMQILDKTTGAATPARSLRDFFQSLSPQTFTFDPKVLFDEQAQRFVLVTLEQSDPAGSASDTSSIFLAVSQSADPNGSWFRTRIDARTTVGTQRCWGDFPGFGFDEQALYVALNLFEFDTLASCEASRLWIVDKNGFYAGGTADVRKIDPYAAVGAQALTTQVARIRGNPPSGATGTWLVGFDGLTNGTTDFLQVARVVDPLGSPSVEIDDVSMGNIAGGPVPPASQPNGFLALDAGDRRALDAVWRDNQLWLTFTTNPPTSADAGEATAHWVRLGTGNATQPVLADQGNIGGEQLHANTHTYYPAIDINERGHVVVGFSASAAGTPNLFAGAYAVSRRPADPPGTMSAPVTIKAGVASYLRTFDDGQPPGEPNRWGDYSSVALDPVDQCFWVYNQWAAATNTCSASGGENGCWATTIARTCVCDGTEASGDADLDGTCDDREVDLAITNTDNRGSVNAGASLVYTIAVSNPGGNAVAGALVNDAFPAPLSCTWTCSATAGTTCPASGTGDIANASASFAPGGTATFSASCSVPPTASASTLSNTATVAHASDTHAANNTATDATTVVPRADLRVTKTDGVTAIDAGAQVTYTIVVANLTAAPSGALVTDTFAAPLQSCTWTCSAAGANVCPTSGSGGIAASVSLAASGSVTFTARCTVAAGASGMLTNTAAVAGPNDPDPSNNTATDANTAIRPRSDIALSKTDGVAAVNAGGTVSYTIVARNNGTATTAGIAIADTFQSPLAACAWTCAASAGSACAAGAGGVLADTVTLAGGGTATYTATCSVPADATVPSLVNIATATYGNDPSAANNVAVDDDTVVRPRADLSIANSDGRASIDAGREIAYTITVANPGPVAVSGAQVFDAFAAPLEACRWTCTPSPGSTCTASGTGNIADTVALAASGSATWVATCRVALAATGTLTNTATVSYGNDTNAANDAASDMDTAIVPPVFVNSFE